MQREPGILSSLRERALHRRACFTVVAGRVHHQDAAFVGVHLELPVQGGASAGTLTAKPAPGWEHALNPGEAVSGILVSGDMSTTGMGTVTYNDGKRILAFGHQFFDLGPVDMPIAKSEILTVLSSTYQPNKVGNATEVVGALRQDILQANPNAPAPSVALGAPDVSPSAGDDRNPPR